MANRFKGAMGKGAARLVREVKHSEAEERNMRTLPERRRAARKAA